MPAAPRGVPRQPPGRRWLSRRALRLHAALLVAVPGCLAAGWFELTRARAGNELSWLYVFEWPFFAGFAVYLWWRLLRDEAGEGRGEAGEREAPAAGTGSAAAPGGDPPDPQLQAWNDYLARLHAQSPPGGPPRARPPGAR